MEAGAQILLTLSGLVLVALGAAAAGERLGAPLLLVFLAVGMLAGPEGPGGILVGDVDFAFTLASAALAIILLDGGMRTRPETLAVGLRPGLTLATLGTVMTAAIVAGVAKMGLGVGWGEALLVGAIVSSTDAAAVFSLVGRGGADVNRRLAASLETESGFNDPIAVFMTLTLAEVLAGRAHVGVFSFIGDLILQGGLGLAFGLAGGWALARAKPRLRLAAGLRPVLTLAGGLFIFALAQAVGGSGFLAVYLAGLMQARADRGVVESEARALDGFAWLAQLGLFLVLGLLATPSHLLAVAAPAIAIAVALTLIARPLAVALCLAPLGFKEREILFASWAGLRGATPIFLGLIPIAVGAPNANLYFSAAFVVVTLSLVVQGWTTPLVAQVLRVGEDVDPGPIRLSPVRGAAIAVALAAAVTASMFIGRDAPVVEPSWRPESVAALDARAARGDVGLVKSLPADWTDIADQQRKRQLFAAVVAPLVEAENARVLADRKQAAAFLAAEKQGRAQSLSEQARRDVLARAYRVGYDELDELTARADIVPVTLAVAQAALTTGWGDSVGAREADALFGRRPEADGSEGGRAAYPDLAASVADYVRALNTHPAFADFRAARAAARAAGRRPTGRELVAHIAPFASDGKAFAASVAQILEAPSVARYEAAADASRP